MAQEDQQARLAEELPALMARYQAGPHRGDPHPDGGGAVAAKILARIQEVRAGRG